MQDLSNLLKPDPVTVLSPTSQAGGNQFFSNENAATAPGSQPASPATSITGEVIDHEPPLIETSGDKVKVGTDGKSQPRSSGYSPSAPTWKTM